MSYPRRAVIVGAGLAGLTAGVLLTQAGYRIDIFEKRKHIGGNCFDSEEEGWNVHQYGPHIFHTSNTRVYEFLSRFTSFVPYEHRVLACRENGVLLPIPYNLKTEQIIGRRLSDEEIIEWFFKDYSSKMWGRPWEDLSDNIRNRVPKRRENDDDRYFTDIFQGLPKNGYSDMFDSMLSDIGLKALNLACPSDDWKKFALNASLVVFTGSIDEYHGYSLGRLPYRSLRMETKHCSVAEAIEKYPVAVINHCNRRPETRETNYGGFTPTPADLSTFRNLVPIVAEYPETYEPKKNEQFYPVPWGDALYQQYVASPVKGLRAKQKVIFCGRLGLYRYMNMDQVVLDTMEKIDDCLATKG